MVFRAALHQLFSLFADVPAVCSHVVECVVPTLPIDVLYLTQTENCLITL